MSNKSVFERSSLYIVCNLIRKLSMLFVVYCLIIFNCLLLQDKYKRALADTENLRQRSQKMIDDAKLYGKLL